MRSIKWFVNDKIDVSQAPKNALPLNGSVPFILKDEARPKTKEHQRESPLSDAPHTPSSKREEEIATSFSKNGENPRDNTKSEFCVLF